MSQLFVSFVFISFNICITFPLTTAVFPNEANMFIHAAHFRTLLGLVQRKGSFEPAQNVPIQIVLLMRKVSPGPLLSV